MLQFNKDSDIYITEILMDYIWLVKEITEGNHVSQKKNI